MRDRINSLRTQCLDRLHTPETGDQTRNPKPGDPKPKPHRDLKPESVTFRENRNVIPGRRVERAYEGKQASTSCLTHKQSKPKAKSLNSSSQTIDHKTGLAVFTDGACEPNPGPGSWAFVVYLDGQEVHSAAGTASTTTSNRMELSGIISALEWLEANGNGRPAAIYTDSTYAANGANTWRHSWRRKNWRKGGSQITNADLWIRIDATLTRSPQRIAWVKGHSRIKGNVRADRLASDALRAWKHAPVRRAAA